MSADNSDRERPTLVYRLDVVYPPGSDADGWEHEGWVSDHVLTMDPDDYDPGFWWPRANRRYLSRRAAEQRAELLRKYGAFVIVVASDPITWGAR